MSWRDLYESCLCEANPDKLEKLIYDFEGAIFLRYKALSDCPDRSAELQAIHQAVERVLELKTRMLGWPPPVAPFSMEDTGFLSPKQQTSSERN
jgi:hypothetical protein